MARLIRTVAIAVVVVLALAAGALFALGRTLGVGPFALGSPASWVYLAIARNGEDGDARDIEVIDLATGDRQLFALDDRAFDIALSRDRRTLYVGSTNGRILELDALRGTVLGEIKLTTSGEVRRLLVLPGGSRMIATSTVVLDASASLVDLELRREKATLALGNRLIGRSVARGQEPLLSVADRGTTEQLLTLSLEPFRVREETLLSSAPVRGIPRTAAATLLGAPDGSLLALSPFSLRLTVLSPGFSDRRGVDLPASGPSGISVVPGLDGDIVLSADRRVVHLCAGTGQRASRFRADWDRLELTAVGNECGKFVRLGDGTLYLAVRGRAELRQLDPATGQVKRTLALAGYPQRAAF